MKKRVLAILLTLLLAVGLAPAVFAVETTYYLDGSVLHGSDFTDIPAIAEGLDQVFAGVVNLYKDVPCEFRVEAKLGSRVVSSGKVYYMKDLDGNLYGGYSCYIYANAVYSTLFGDVVNPNNVHWRHSEYVLKNVPTVSYELFRENGVRVGAYLRTTSKTSGAYDPNTGHSMIVLAYDQDSITYLEGNGDGNGLIRAVKTSWSDFNYTQMSRRGYRLSFIVQPTRAYYDSLSHDYIGAISKVRTYNGDFSDVAADSWYASYTAMAYELGFMNGEGDGLFEPEGKLTVAEALTIVARFRSAFRNDGYKFAVNEELWYAPYYEYLEAIGINTAFSAPDKAISRANFAVLLCRVLTPEARVETLPNVSFSDVPENTFYTWYVNTLARCGIITGDGDGLFRPMDTISRAEAAAIISRTADQSMRVK